MLLLRRDISSRDIDGNAVRRDLECLRIVLPNERPGAKAGNLEQFDRAPISLRLPFDILIAPKTERIYLGGDKSFRLCSAEQKI